MLALDLHDATPLIMVTELGDSRSGRQEGSLPHASGSFRVPGAYEVLGVHPSAPGELINAAYWMTVNEIQAEREAGRPVDRELHLITRAYESVSTAEMRAGYNATTGQSWESLRTRPMPKRWWPFGTLAGDGGISLYEVIGLHETAPPELAVEAYRIMRALYLRVPMEEGRRRRLLSLLERAHWTLSDASRRARYTERIRILAEQTGRWRAPVRVATLAVQTLCRLVPSGRTRTIEQPTMFRRLSFYLEAGESARDA